jgi:hypothetical protein
MKPASLFFAPVGNITTGGTGSGLPGGQAPARSPQQQKRSAKLKQALAAARELVAHLESAQTHDLEKPLGQRDRHEYAAKVNACTETIAVKMEDFE